MSRRAVTVLGVTLVGGAGYYLYTAGGDPKAAQKHAEADASKLSAKLKSETPGREKEFEKRGEAYAAQAGKKADDAVAQAQARASEAQSKLSQYSKDTRAEVNSAIDKFDKTVEKKASEAKGWFGFGGGK